METFPESGPVAWPRKERELIDAQVDSTIWNRFEFRDDDIIIANWPKSGCTWLQQIVGQLIFAGDDDVAVSRVSPWVELAVSSQSFTLARLRAQTHRRFMKTHLPVDALVYSAKARYIYIGRDGRDVAWSAFNHFRRLRTRWYEAMRERSARFGRPMSDPPRDFRQFFNRWLEDGYPFWPFWQHVRSWWEIRQLPNLMLIHFSDLRDRLPHNIRRIAEFLGLTISADRWPSILQHCSLQYMTQHAARLLPHGNEVFAGGAPAFFSGGGRPGWQRELDAHDLRRYEDALQSHLPERCAEWLAVDYRSH